MKVWGSKFPTYLGVKLNMEKKNMEQWNASDALPTDLKHSGLLAIIAASDWHKTHQVIQWLLNPHGVHGAKPPCIFVWPAPSPPCNLHVRNVFQISSALGFYLNVKRFCLNVKRRALSEKRKSSWGRERMGGLLYLASPWKQLSRGLRLINYQTITASWWVSQNNWLPSWKMLQPWLFGAAWPSCSTTGQQEADSSHTVLGSNVPRTEVQPCCLSQLFFFLLLPYF